MPRDNDVETSVERVDPLVGTIFDKRFRVEERIASGGFGAIYRATHIKSGHPIALKVLLPSLAQDLGVVARFRREGDTLTALRNPHTISAYELGQAADRTLFITMELLHGESLFERYRANGPFEWKRMVKIAVQVCESLEEAHAKGIVHRDLKPTNIHLEDVEGDRDFVKVLDFGIAKILRGSDFDSADITNAGQMIGTLDYMSPEQMLGGKVTGQTDIYTLGIVMYEMIAGTTPFPEAMTAAQALASVTRTKPEPLFLRAPVPEELDRIVMKCLERDMPDRYKVVGELRGDLLRLLAGEAPDRANLFDTKPVPKAPLDESTTFTPPPKQQQLLAHSKQPWGDEETSFTPPPQQLIAQSRRDHYGDEATSFTPPPEKLIAQSRRDDHGDEATSFTPPPEQLLAESRRPRRPSGEQTSFTPPPQQILDELRTPRRKASPVVEWTDDDERAPTTFPDEARGSERAVTVAARGSRAHRDDDSGIVTPPIARTDAQGPSSRAGSQGATPPLARAGSQGATPPLSRADSGVDVATPPLSRVEASTVPFSRADVASALGGEAATVPFTRSEAARGVASARDGRSLGEASTIPVTPNSLGEAPTIPAQRSDAARAMPRVSRDNRAGRDEAMRGDIRTSGDDPMHGDAVRGEISTDPFDRDELAPPPVARDSQRKAPTMPPPIPPTTSMRPAGKTAPPPNALVPPRPTSPPMNAQRASPSPPVHPSPPARPLPRVPQTPVPNLVAAPFSENRPPSNPAMQPFSENRSPSNPAMQPFSENRPPSNPAMQPYPPQPTYPTPPPGQPYPPAAPYQQPPYPHASPYPQAPYPYQQAPHPYHPTPVPNAGASAADMMRSPSSPMLQPMPGALHTPVPHQGGYSPTPPGVAPYQGNFPRAPSQSPSAQFDMGRIAAREAFIRKLVWIIVLVLGTGVGFIVATQL